MARDMVNAYVSHAYLSKTMGSIEWVLGSALGGAGSIKESSDAGSCSQAMPGYAHDYNMYHVCQVIQGFALMHLSRSMSCPARLL